MTTRDQQFPGFRHDDSHTAVLFDYGMGTLDRVPPEIADCPTCLEEYPGTGEVVAILRAAAPLELRLDGPPEVDRPVGFGHRGLDAALAGILGDSGSADDGGPPWQGRVRVPAADPASAPVAGPTGRSGADGRGDTVAPVTALRPPTDRIQPAWVRRQRGRRLWFAAAAAVLAVLFLGAGVLLGQQRLGSAPPPPAAPSPGQLLAFGTTGSVTASTVLTPMSGWVDVQTTVRGIPAGERCSVVLVDKAGREYVAASWTTGEPTPAGASIDGSVIVDSTPIGSVIIRNDQGRVFSDVPVA